MSKNNIQRENVDALSADYVCMYYQRQYARIEHHESQRLILSNVVITITVLGFTFGFGEISKLSILSGIGLPLIIIIANCFAVIYAHGSSAICHVHQDRAHATLERHAASLYLIQKEFELPKLRRGRGLSGTLACLHILLIFASFMPIVAYFNLTLK